MFVLLGRAVIDKIAGQNRQIRPRHEFVHGCYRLREISRRVEFAHDPLRIRRVTLNKTAEQLAARDDVGSESCTTIMIFPFRHLSDRERTATCREHNPHTTEPSIDCQHRNCGFLLSRSKANQFPPFVGG